MILEWLFALYDPRVRSLLNARIFVNAPDPTCRRRRLARDTVERGRTAEPVSRQWEETVRPMAEQYVLPLKGSPTCSFRARSRWRVRGKYAASSCSKPHEGRIYCGMAEEIATFGGGCFWCLEAVFDELEGVKSVESGYAGGKSAHPTYKQVCSGTTGHAEVVRVTFDPETISYKDILDVFFAIHDPTTLNRQGNDIGTQYRSVIFYNSPEQRRVAEQVIEQLNASGDYHSAVVTQLEPAPAFYVAEDYHQQYFENNEFQPYCQFVVSPKVLKFRSKFAAMRKR